MKYGVVAEYDSDIAFFGAEVGKARCLLIGSSHSMIGSPQRADANHMPYYYVLKFLNRIAADSKAESEPPPPYCTYEQAYDIAMEALVGRSRTA